MQLHIFFKKCNTLCNFREWDVGSNVQLSKMQCIVKICRQINTKCSLRKNVLADIKRECWAGNSWTFPSLVVKYFTFSPEYYTHQRLSLKPLLSPWQQQILGGKCDFLWLQLWESETNAWEKFPASLMKLGMCTFLSSLVCQQLNYPFHLYRDGYL